MRTRHLASLRAPEIADHVGPGAIVVLPLGAIEQHGPHLPHDTDLVIAAETAAALVDRAGDELDLWLLPPVAYTRSNEHAWSPGSIWLRPETLLAVVDDIGRSVAALPARRLVLLNGHGGNSALLNVACRELRLHHDLLTFLVHPSVPPDQGGDSAAGELGMGVHAGHDETSLMLHLRPGSVDMAEARRNVPEGLAANRHVRFGGTVTFGWASDDFGPDGIIGDPTGASAAHGAALFEAAVTRLVDALGEIAAFDLPMG